MKLYEIIKKPWRHIPIARKWSTRRCWRCAVPLMKIVTRMYTPWQPPFSRTAVRCVVRRRSAPILHLQTTGATNTSAPMTRCAKAVATPAWVSAIQSSAVAPSSTSSRLWRLLSSAMLLRTNLFELCMNCASCPTSVFGPGSGFTPQHQQQQPPFFYNPHPRNNKIEIF